MKSKYAFITLRDRPELMDRAAAWFHEKWRVPTEAYPSIDSLKEIARFFSVTIDDLICSDEMISVAENEKKEFADKHVSLICNVMDILPAMLLFIPAFGNGSGSSETVSLFGLSGITSWVKTVFIVITGITILNGICGAIIANFNKPLWNRHRLITGVVLSILSVTVFIVTRQPYAGIVCFMLLVMKATIGHSNQAVWHDDKRLFKESAV